MYVGNLPFDSNEMDVRTVFEQYGEITEIKLPEDRDTGRPRGFGFVTMATKDQMLDAIKGLDGHEFNGRNLRVNEAEERRRPGGGGGGGGYGDRKPRY